MTSDQSFELLSCLAKSNDTVSASLYRAIEQYSKNEEYDARTDGLDYLQVKNGIMMSYLIDLTMLLRCKLGSEHRDVGKQCVNRLQEMKAALEKMRPLEKRMRYQIDKLLALSTLGAGTFAAMRDSESETNEKDDVKIDGSDPLSFKPDLQGMMSMFEDGNEQHSEKDESVQEETEGDLKTALEKEDKDSGVYQPPRLQAMPFQLNEQHQEKEEHQRQKHLARMQRSELADVVRAQFTDAPEEEDIRGGAMLGKQREVSKKLSQREADVAEFEETHMIRLTMGKKEKKERKRIMREEMSNLGAIADFGNVVAGVDDAFGDGTRGRFNQHEDDGNKGFVIKGMRKRKVEVLEPRVNRKSKARSTAGKNSNGKSKRRK